MHSDRERLILIVDEIDGAASPEAFKLAVGELLAELSAQAHAARVGCAHDWQNRNAGREWAPIALKLRRQALAYLKE